MSIAVSLLEPQALLVVFLYQRKTANIKIRCFIFFLCILLLGNAYNIMQVILRNHIVCRNLMVLND